MITQKQQTSIGEAGANEARQTSESLVQAGLTGIPLLDDKIRKNIPGGGVVLVAGGMSGDASILGAQIAARAISAYEPVLFLSTRMTKESLTERIFSSLTDWSYDNLGGGFLHFEEEGDRRIPYEADRDLEFTERALPFIGRHEQCLDFHFSHDLRDKPLEVLDEILSNAEIPACLILDDLQIYGLIGSPGNYTKVDPNQLATAVMRRLTTYAHANGIPVVVLCQQSPDGLTRTRKRVDTKQIADFPAAGNQCDLFVGISQQRSAAEDIEADGFHSPFQFLHTRGSDRTSLIPVTIEFDMQRFTEREDQGIAGDRDLARRAAKISLESKHRGYALFRRDDFKRLCGLHNPDCINVFALCLLVAETRRGVNYGTLFYGKQKLGEMLGINRKRVATAIDLLVKEGLMENTGKKMKRATIYRLVDFANSQNPEIPGYFMLAHNLRDPQRGSLLGDPLLYRVWLGCLYAAKFSRDAEFLERGQLMYNPYELAELTGDSPEDADWALMKLVEAGRMEEVTLESENAVVLEITNYKIYQNGHFYSRAFLREMAISHAGQTLAN